jgi:hypothetical protein
MNTEGSPDARNLEVLLEFKVAEFQIALGMACWLVGNKPQSDRFCFEVNGRTLGTESEQRPILFSK